MKNILLVILLFACSISTAQTFTVNGVTYNIVSGDLLTVANAYAKGYDIGNAAARGITCAPTSVEIGLRDNQVSGEINLGTYVASRTTNIDATSIRWTLTRWNGDVIDITDDVEGDGDINFGYRARNGFSGPLPPLDDYVQGGDMIRVVYVDDCGTYVYTYTIPTSEPAIRVPRDRMRPPKIIKPVI